MLEQISLHNFRNLNLTTNLEAANLLLAPNGSGKSNFLESIYYSAFGRPFRPYQTIEEVIGGEDSFSKISLKIDGTEIEVITTKTETRIQRKFLVNGKAKTISEIKKHIPIILFAPHAVNIVSEEPGLRRQDLDDFLSIVDREYAEILPRYEKVLHNRNALLKHLRDFPQDRGELEFWTAELVKLATVIFHKRQHLFNEIQEFSSLTAEEIYHKQHTKFEITYVPFRGESDDYEASLKSLFAANQEKEIIVGQTLYGPHKDDYILAVDDKNLRYLGSRGEQRIAVLIWKLAQAKYIGSKQDRNPILLIDDLMSELDTEHRQTAANYLLNQESQFLITAADTNDVPKELREKSKSIVIK